MPLIVSQGSLTLLSSRPGQQVEPPFHPACFCLPPLWHPASNAQDHDSVLLLGSFKGSYGALRGAQGVRGKDRSPSVFGVDCAHLERHEWGAPGASSGRSCRPALRWNRGSESKPVLTQLAHDHHLLPALHCPGNCFSWHSRVAGHVRFFSFKYSADIKVEGV